MTPPQMSGAAPAAVLGRAHANGSCQELRPTHTLGHSPYFVSLPDSRRSIYQAGAHVAIVTHS
jgi:hypothetical protein